ncbi:hypothetical protein BGZ94_003674, partial [Podila epigama]
DALRLEKDLDKIGSKLVPVPNLVDRIWRCRPRRPANPLRILSTKTTGMTHTEKIVQLRKVLEQHDVAGFVVSGLDEIAWLFNIRGSDVHCNPVFFAYAIVTPSNVDLFLQPESVSENVREFLGPTVTIQAYDDFYDHLRRLSSTLQQEGKQMMLGSRTNLAMALCLGIKNTIEVRSPLIDAKAIKNNAELSGMRQCHLRDAAAMINYFAWLEDALGKGIVLDEVEAADQLHRFRSQQEGFVGPSFDTISSTGANGAIIHYKPEKQTAARIDSDLVYLCDSGGQYVDGTTDITRTLHFGTPSYHEKRCFTRVLQGHIAIDSAIFPEGTTGYHLDILSRRALWSDGLDFNHGTGHGVGAFLNVHEGPQGCGARPSFNEVPLKPGMTLTNEPGYYEPGQFGIRIENVLLLKEVETRHRFEGRKFFGFEHITFVPIQVKMVDTTLLSPFEVDWINKYHTELSELFSSSHPLPMAITSAVNAASATLDVESGTTVHVDATSSTSSTKKGHTRQRRKKKKNASSNASKIDSQETNNSTEKDDAKDLNVEVEWITEQPTELAPEFAEFQQVFQRFMMREPESELKAQEDSGDHEQANNEQMKKSDESGSDSDAEEKAVASKKKLKRLNRMSVAVLKQMAKHPEVVDWIDVTSSDPNLLVQLKGYRNTVPVPSHWNQKRKYLQGKRGIEKMPFDLPDFIKDTGIMELRNAVKEKEDASKLKTKTRERVQPKMGKIDIDYQKLHDAFFRYQTRPRLSIHGELYHEGKEFETKAKEVKPGNLSEELIAALSIPPLAPPPWLINMQRYGPPPGYKNLKIPGLNAPIPEGAQWGYHPGGWGKPPVDEFNRPLYGDVFGSTQTEVQSEYLEPVEKSLWGELDPEEEEEEEEDEEEDEDEETEGDEDEVAKEEEDNDGIQQGLVTPSGLQSVASGLETPDFIELRKDNRRSQQADDDEPKQLYTVLQQKQTSITGFMGSQHVYDLSSAASSKKRKNMGEVDVELDPSELENMDAETLQEKYEQGLQASMPEAHREDLSDLVGEHLANQAKKRKQAQDKKTGKEKDKNFKF